VIVDVYRNLRPGYGTPCWSIRDPKSGRVLGHATDLELEDPTFIVSAAGRERVRREGRKNVHAVVRGTLVAASPKMSHPSIDGRRRRCYQIHMPAAHTSNLVHIRLRADATVRGRPAVVITPLAHGATALGLLRRVARDLCGTLPPLKKTGRTVLGHGGSAPFIVLSASGFEAGHVLVPTSDSWDLDNVSADLADFLRAAEALEPGGSLVVDLYVQPSGDRA